MKELARQAVHLSGLVFVLAVFFIDRGLISAGFFLIATLFLGFSFLASRGNRQMRSIMRHFEREKTRTPFIGAFWFYFSCGLAFMTFPLNVAIVACSILAVSDSVSTLVGVHFGRHKIVGEKSAEGSLAFLASAFLVALTFTYSVHVSIVVAAASTLAELVPEARQLRRLRENGIMDDNLVIILVAGLSMVLL